MSGPYDKSFFEFNLPYSSGSAARVVPVVMELVRPASVVDVGCGVGTWLAEFMGLGVQDAVGIDGAYVNRDQLTIPPANFLDWNLEKPIRLERKFDLAVSLEVAEHLTPERADSFVDDLSRLAPVVLFSAAVPHQGGHMHLNEQWPSYWNRFFAARGMRLVDSLRARFWHDRQVHYYYRQNMLLFVQEDKLSQFPDAGQYGPTDIVHPELLEHPTLKRLLRALPRTFAGAVRRRMPGSRGGHALRPAVTDSKP